MAIFTKEGAAQVDVKQRIRAAEALGRAGDPRFNALEPEMLPIPELSGVLLGRYPVTVAEYRRFVDGEGYDREEYWKVGWKQRVDEGCSAPKKWEDQEPFGNRPVTGVSWFEAMAYCEWLSKCSRRRYRLPTSEEWQRAAVHPAGGDYPWGATKPDPDRLNYDGNVGMPTPVGVYPSGAAFGGHQDMAGNVWEWSASDDHDFPVVRGGSWRDVALICRSAYRNYDAPGDRYADFGFRLSRSL